MMPAPSTTTTNNTTPTLPNVPALTSLEGDEDVPLSVKLARLRAQRDEELKKRKEALSPKKLPQPSIEPLKPKSTVEPLKPKSTVEPLSSAVKRESTPSPDSVPKKIKTEPTVAPMDIDNKPTTTTLNERKESVVAKSKVIDKKEAKSPVKKSNSDEKIKREKKEQQVNVKTENKEDKTERKEVKVKTERKDEVVKVKTEKTEVVVVKKEKKEEVPKKKVVTSKKPAASKKTKVEDDEEEDGESQDYSASQDNDGTIKWKTLEHSGPFFPPPYVPHGVPLVYDGQKLNLEPEAEEVAGFFGALIETDHGKNPTFQENFFADFTQLLKETNSKYKNVIREFKKCDFTLMFNHFQKQKEERKAMTKEQKLALKAEKQKVDDQYGWALLDGAREKVGNFRAEPPGLFRGRGKHPRTGKLKTRVQPEQVTINIGSDAPVPRPPAGHRWGSVVHDSTVTWLATWTENINGNQKYVFLAPGSSLKSQSDLKKFETARKLKQHVGLIRDNYFRELKDKEMMVRQRATALWLIDKLALRAGNEKGEDEADTVGCCSLRCEHISLQEPDQVTFDFLGKDSIRYFNQVAVDPLVFKNLQIFMKPPKTPADPIFDRLNTASLNKYLNTLMPGLTAKVFRTYNASHTFQNELKDTPYEGTVAEKLLAYNRANRQVAILCNHQRAVPKTHDQAMERLREKILTLKYQRHLVRKELLANEGKKELKKLLADALDPESDMDDDTIKRKRDEEKDIEKLKQEKKKASPSSPSSPSKKRTFTTDTLVKKFTQLGERIQAAKHQVIDKDENKTTALGTSKTNYIDPRITVAWCEGHQVPMERMFNKSLREKFKWAMDVSKTWQF